MTDATTRRIALAVLFVGLLVVTAGPHGTLGLFTDTASVDVVVEGRGSSDAANATERPSNDSTAASRTESPVETVTTAGTVTATRTQVNQTATRGNETETQVNQTATTTETETATATKTATEGGNDG